MSQGIGKRELRQDRCLALSAWRHVYIMRLNATNGDQYASQDLNAASVGTVVNINEWTQAPSSVALSVLDAGSSVSVSGTLEGLNQFGQRVTETFTALTDPAGTGTYVQSTAAYSYVDKFTITALSGAGASDVLRFGVLSGDSSAPIKLGLPAVPETDLIGIWTGGGASNADAMVYAQNYDGENYTIEIDYPAPFTSATGQITLGFDPRSLNL